MLHQPAIRRQPPEVRSGHQHGLSSPLLLRPRATSQPATARAVPAGDRTTALCPPAFSGCNRACTRPSWLPVCPGGGSEVRHVLCGALTVTPPTPTTNRSLAAPTAAAALNATAAAAATAALAAVIGAPLTATPRPSIALPSATLPSLVLTQHRSLGVKVCVGKLCWVRRLRFDVLRLLRHQCQPVVNQVRMESLCALQRVLPTPVRERDGGALVV